MNKTEFSRAYYAFGAATAAFLARGYGVAQAQIELWLKSPVKPAYWGK